MLVCEWISHRSAAAHKAASDFGNRRCGVCQTAGLINAPIICSINRYAGLCFVFYVSAFTAAITAAGLYFTAAQPPNFSHPCCLSPPLSLSPFLSGLTSLWWRVKRACCLKLFGNATKKKRERKTEREKQLSQYIKLSLQQHLQFADTCGSFSSAGHW